MVLPLRLIPRAAAAARLPVAAPCAPRPVLRRAQFLPASAMAAAYTAGSAADRRPLFRQLFEKESSTYTYLLADVAGPDKPAVVSPARPCFGSLQPDLDVATGVPWVILFGWYGVALQIHCAANGGLNVSVHSNLRAISADFSTCVESELSRD
jgi:hypothetical protein